MNITIFSNKLYDICNLEVTKLRELAAQNLLNKLTERWPELEKDIATAKQYYSAQEEAHAEYVRHRDSYGLKLREINNKVSQIVGKNLYVDNYNFTSLTLEYLKRICLGYIDTKEIREAENKLRLFRKTIAASASSVKTNLMLSDFLTIVFSNNNIDNELARGLIDELRNS